MEIAEMDQSNRLQQAFIIKLPIELVRQILSALPDTESLRSAVVSCLFFYSAFIKAEAAIAKRVLLNQIAEPLLPELLVAYQSSLLPGPGDSNLSRKLIHDLIRTVLFQRQVSDVKVSLKEALCLGRLHADVESFAQDLVAKALNTVPLSHHPEPVTEEESTRIRRALYRFEILCNYFRDSWEEGSNLQEVFLHRISPWEIEQVACVHDFLARAIMPAFNDVAEHDIIWGMSNIEYGDDIQLRGIQCILPLGLRKLREIVGAKTYDERYRILDPCLFSRTPDCYIFEVFHYESLQGENAVMSIGNFTPPIVDDLDPGPETIWQWAHWEEDEVNWTYQPDRDSLRQWGYVFWNKARLDTVGVLQQPWENPESPEEALEKEHEAMRQRGWMQNSWEQRERVYYAGGSGWWSWGDESKIQ